MKTAKLMMLFSLCLILHMWSANMAQAANGTLTFTYKYQDPVTGAVTTVPYAFVYLHSATKPPPMEKFFSHPDRILSGSFGSGNYQIAVPEGSWYVRINQRADPFKRNSAGAKGPPKLNDLTWIAPAPVTVTAGQTTSLGTIYASPYNPTPVIIKGTIKNTSGVPQSGFFIRAQTEPCQENSGCGYDGSVCEQYTNLCGPAKFISTPTDATGAFTLTLRDAGTYYIYASNCFPNGPGCSGWCGPACIGVGYPTPVTAQKGDVLTLSIVTY